MSDPTLHPVNLDGMDDDEHREKWRIRILLVFIALIGFAVAAWIGAIVDDAQEDTLKAEAGQEQAQVEKFNLAQQITTACADPESGLDEQTEQRLCQDAKTIVREGPEGAQGVPGVQGPAGIQGATGLTGAQGIRGPPGTPGADGTNGVDGAQGPTGEKGATGDTGPQGPQGEKGDTGAVGPQGLAGQDGEPPVAWVVYGPNEQVIERCVRADDFTNATPTYTCTQESPVPQ